MSIFSRVTKYFMGDCGIIKENEDIVNGKIVNSTSSTGSSVTDSQANVSEVIHQKDEHEWIFPCEYIRDMQAKGMSARTAKEYAFDLKSFGVCLDTITSEQITNRLRSLKMSTKRRKLTALRSFAKWRLLDNESHLFMLLSNYKIQEK